MRLRWAILWALVALGTAVFVTTCYREVERRREVENHLAQKEAESRRLADQMARRRERVEFLKTPEGQAWAARDQLNMSFPGEKIYRLDESPEEESLPVKSN